MLSSPQQMVVSAELLALRNTTPSEYPCISVLGFYQSIGTCRKACCVDVPPKTLAGEDSPKWGRRRLLPA